MEVTERRLSIDGVAVEAILAPDKAIRPIPAETILSSPPGDEDLMPPPPKPYGNPRPLSFAARNGNRLSLSFPIQLPDRERGGRQTASSSASFSSHSSLAESSAPISPPKDSAGFMVALAAQERHVLELKEELNRAEGKLKNLKRQWASHEGSKKKTAINHVEQLHPMQPSSRTADADDIAATRRSPELDRRKAELATVAKDSRRKIITGGHTRALSLLSPDRGSYDSSPSPASGLTSDDESKQALGTVAPGPMKMDPSQGSTRINPNRIRYSYQDSAANGVKQIAEDIKAGLWTFMEDLRQATVGEEAIQSPNNQSGLNQVETSLLDRKGSPGSLVEPGRSPVPSRSVLKRFEKRKNAASPAEGMFKHVTSNTQPQAPKPSVVTSISAELDDDDWANWDSPVSKEPFHRWRDSSSPLSQDAGRRSSALISGTSQDTKTEADKGSLRNTLTREDIPWPVLNNLTPDGLKRTASAIMREWEKTLTPPSETPNNTMSISSISGSNLESDHEARLLLSNLP